MLAVKHLPGLTQKRRLPSDDDFIFHGQINAPMLLKDICDSRLSRCTAVKKMKGKIYSSGRASGTRMARTCTGPWGWQNSYHSLATCFFCHWLIVIFSGLNRCCCGATCLRCLVSRISTLLTKRVWWLSSPSKVWVRPGTDGGHATKWYRIKKKIKTRFSAMEQQNGMILKVCMILDSDVIIDTVRCHGKRRKGGKATMTS